MSTQPRRKSILIVDDDINVVLALNRNLHQDFKIIAACAPAGPVGPF